jgi:hypothetical protein
MTNQLHSMTRFDEVRFPFMIVEGRDGKFSTRWDAAMNLPKWPDVKKYYHHG